MKTLSTVLLLGLAALRPACSDASDAILAHEENAVYVAQIEQHRAERVEGLKKPLGWLSLVGLHWIEPGEHRLGSAPDNDIVLAVGPAHLGVITLGNDGIVLVPTPEAAGSIRCVKAPCPGSSPAFTVDGVTPEGKIHLRADSSGKPSQIAFEPDVSGFSVIERVGKFALRVRDANAKARTGFTGIPFHDIDADWKIQTRFEPHEEGHTIDIANVIGQLQAMPNPGALVFEKDGKVHRIEAIGNDDGSLFLIFADRTSGKETYGAGRFLDVAGPEDGKVVVDFNLAYNPPCAFNEYSTCPLPPPENRLNLAVTAGEKKPSVH
ncbi:MAG: DUF1684 domain-containing protein [Lysobacteraceae bacterium]